MGSITNVSPSLTAVMTSESTSCSLSSTTSWHLYQGTTASDLSIGSHLNIVYQSFVQNFLSVWTTTRRTLTSISKTFSILTDIFRAIIKNASPIPRIPADGALVTWSTPPATRKRAASPPSFQDPPIYSAIKRPRYSKGHDEASDDEGEAHLLFSPVTRPRPTSVIIELSQPL